MKLSLKIPLCFFDIEATGVNVAHDRIIEIAVIKVFPNGDVQRKTNLLNPTIPIPADSTAIHGISNEQVVNEPTFREVAKEYSRFFEGADLAGFNILKFDVPILVEEFLRADVEFDYSRKKIIDSQKIFHLMEKRTLAAAYKFYCQKEMENAHSAESDTIASMEVLMSQIEKYDGLDVTDGLDRKVGMIKNDMETLAKLVGDDMVDLAGRMVKNNKGEVIFNFGKHKGKTVEKIFKDEPAYYDWMMNGDFPLDTKRKLTSIKLAGLKK